MRAASGYASGAVGLALVPLLGVGTAGAATPLRHGWWSQTSVVSGVPLAPPDVPTDGLYVQGSSTAPVAISAVDIQVDAGQQVEALTLAVAGTPVISGSPVACVLTSDFVAVQAGAWSDAPSYDCTTHAVGLMDATRAHVTFDLRRVSVGGRVRLAILAAGQADRIAFDAPTEADLSFRTQATSPVVAPSPQANLPEPPLPTAPEPAPVAGNPGNSMVGVPVPASPLSPQVSAPELLSTTQPPPRAEPTRIVTAASTRPSHRLATGLGLGLLLLCICYWADGFGAVPIRRRLAMADIEGSAVRPSEDLQQLIAAGEPRRD